MPQPCRRTRTSPGPGLGRGTSQISTRPGATTTAALMLGEAGEEGAELELMGGTESQGGAALGCNKKREAGAACVPLRAMTLPPLSPNELAEVGRKWEEAMLRGDFEAAWRCTDRIEHLRREQEGQGGFARAPHHLHWNGQPWKGRRVLVRCEHGLGDSLQFLRYCPLLRREASHVAVRAQPALLSLLAGMEGIDDLRDAWTTDPEPAHDVVFECMELAYAFRHRRETLPQKVPYLPVERLLGTCATLPLRASRALQVGVIWAASTWNPRRSLPPEALRPLARLEGVRCFSLQQDQPETALFPSLAAETREIARAAAAMLMLDVIVTVDSMTAHLAGALGRPTLLLLAEQADWRWGLEGSRSPWYPTMRLLRQPTAGDWASVVEHAAQVLTELAETKAAAYPTPEFTLRFG